MFRTDVCRVIRELLRGMVWGIGITLVLAVTVAFAAATVREMLEVMGL